MLKYIAALATVFTITGCSGLGQMKQVELETEVKPDTTIVNIVRRHAFAGDGANIEMWDGDTFIGTLAPGKLLQYKTTPGVHTFMNYMQGSWGVAKGELKAGKTYYLKSNMGFGSISLGAAKADDKRIKIWNDMTVVTIDESKQKAVPAKYIKSAQKTLKRIDDGKANVTIIDDSNAL